MTIALCYKALEKEIGINHEFIADEQVMLAGFDKKEYQYHLIGVKHPNTAIANLYNNFSVLPLKKRITMLNKKRTNNARKVNSSARHLDSNRPAPASQITCIT